MARSSSRPEKKYRSRIDTWLLVVLSLCVAVMVASIVLGWVNAGWLQALQRTFVVGAGIGLILWVLTGTSYTLEGQSLRVASGPFRWRIAIDEITSVKPAGGLAAWMANPALSMNRLELTYRAGKRLLISPANRDQFLKDIAARGVTL